MTKEMKRLPGSGRPKSISAALSRLIKFKSMKDPRLTAVDIRSEVEKMMGKKVPSMWTIRRELKKNGLLARIARKKPFLSLLHKQKRIAFGMKYRHWTKEDWARVVWSDETPVCLFQSFGRIFIRRRVGDANKQEMICPTIKHGGGKIQLWGCFRADQVGPIKRIEGKMDKKMYHGILVTHAIGYLERLRKAEAKKQPKKEEKSEGKSEEKDSKKRKLWVFMQDNDPKHTAKINKAYLDKRCKVEGKEFDVLEWPSQSPDLNPLEHIWRYVKVKLRGRSKKPANLNELFEQFKEEWNNVPKEIMHSTVFSSQRELSR